MNKKIYTHLALIYSHLMRYIDYDKWGDYIIELSKELKVEKIYALEIACGIGRLAERLKKQFDLYLATDLSLAMLNQFKCKYVYRVACEMTALPFKKKFNFIFSAFDSVNYLTSKEKLIKLFNEVDLTLSNEGIFTFDVSLKNNSIKYQRYLNRSGQINGIHYKQISKYDEVKKIHYNIFDLDLGNGNKVREIHRQKIYDFEDYFKIIDKTNFYVSHCYEAFSFQDANAESERAQFILRKKN